MPTMGRPRTKNLDLPPHMHRKNGVYYYVTSGAKRDWIKLHADLSKARVLWAQLENTNSGDGGNFNNRLDAYLVSKKFLSLADKTRKQYENVAIKLRAFFAGSTLDVITPAHIAIWMDEHVSPIQANTGKAIICNVFEIAVRHGEVNANPAKQIKYHKIEGRDRYITDQEYWAIWHAADEHVQIAMDIGYLTGARIQDILDIRLQDITPEGVFVQTGKTKKKMLFLRSDALDEVIARAKALPRSIRGMHLICSRQGQPYQYKTFNGHWLSAIRSVGLDGVHFHDIRAKAATDAKAMGLDYQALLGHATRAISDHYVKQRETERVTSMPCGVHKKQVAA